VYYRSFKAKSRDMEAAGNSWFGWVLKAAELHSASDILVNECVFRKYFGKDSKAFEAAIHSPGAQVFSVILMLWAMAAECFLKALWLHSGRKLVVDGRYNTIPGTNDHQLDSIAAVIHQQRIFDFSEADIDILYRLSGYITSGRYPVPKSAHVRKPTAPDDHILGSISQGWKWPEDDERYGELIARMWHLLKGDDA
jgi:hypothetical protein